MKTKFLLVEFVGSFFDKGGKPLRRKQTLASDHKLWLLFIFSFPSSFIYINFETCECVLDLSKC